METTNNKLAKKLQCENYYECSEKSGGIADHRAYNCENIFLNLHKFSFYEFSRFS